MVTPPGLVQSSSSSHSYLEPVGVRFSSLSHKEAGAGFQLQAAWGPRQGHPLDLLAVHKQRHGVTVHTEGKARPLAGEGGQGKAGSRASPGRARLGVQELDVLLAVTHARQLHAHGDHCLGCIRDGEQHPGGLRGRLHVEEQREITEERAGEVVPGHLAAVGIWTKDVGWSHVGVINLGDLLGRGLPEQLEEPHLCDHSLCEEEKTPCEAVRRAQRGN